MPKQTDTRKRAREVALLMLERGEVPTSWSVRKALGGGSPNTINDEIGKLLSEIGRPAVTPNCRDTSSAFVNEIHAALKSEIPELQKAVAELKISAHERQRFIESLEQLNHRLDVQQSRLTELIVSTAALVAKLEAQIEGVRKHMLMSIEEARQEAREWKDAARAAREEASIWRGSMEAKILALTAERAELQARLELASKSHQTYR